MLFLCSGLMLQLLKYYFYGCIHWGGCQLLLWYTIHVCMWSNNKSLYSPFKRSNTPIFLSYKFAAWLWPWRAASWFFNPDDRRASDHAIGEIYYGSETNQVEISTNDLATLHIWSYPSILHDLATLHIWSYPSILLVYVPLLIKLVTDYTQGSKHIKL